VPHEISAEDMGWVRALARQAQPRLHRSDVDDLEGDGMVALVSAAARYDPDNEAGATFRTYAHHRIVGAMIDGYRGWHGGRRKRHLSFMSIDRLYQDNDEDGSGRRDWIRRAVSVDNHDDFELDLTLDGRLSDPADQMIVALLTLEDLDKQEVAAVFQVTPAAVSHRLKRIRQRLGAT
jgi:RNA polymerase sigma factor (sigma-70 family)